ncbi:DEAD-box helicase [Emydomyces testavorans]|uniref:ATP-dependent RNA helicase n=1 Tax=Emydomyces testavorans TaxID=2070801 RepID=A0AAF0IFP8_9EURO|nr:DEAD-box helicase [Emydomyces testavorans]
MFGSVRRGHVLVRNLPRCICRPTFTSLASRCRIAPNQAITLPVRAFHVSPLLRNFAGQAFTPIDETDVPHELPEKEEKITRFDELHSQGLVDERVIRAVTKDMGLSEMTEIQVETIHHTLRKRDVLAQAKTGTGKTLAFLIPVIQNLIRQDRQLRNPRFSRGHRGTSGGDIRAVIISPTRELAEQIATEARKVVRHTGVQVQTAVGGTRKMEGLRRIQRQGCHLLIGTPGRLIDIFSDPQTGIRAPKLSAFVLDEADRLLDDGFAPAIEQLQEYFPKLDQVDRQTLLFSATIAPQIMNIVRRTLKQDFTFVKTVRDDEVPTHLAVPQRAVFLHGLGNQMPAVMEIAMQAVRNHQMDPEKHKPFKAIVYFNSTSEVTLAKAAFDALRVDPQNPSSGHPIKIATMEMHSRLTQAQRTNNSNNFRHSTSSILFSSDVTARGMDFPNVTHVIQVGVARDRESYIHRLGRTARANKTGEGWLLLTDAEYNDFRNKLRALPIKEDNTSLQTSMVDLSKKHDDHPHHLASIVSQVKTAFVELDYGLKEKAYMAALGTMSTSREKFRQLNEMTKHLWSLDSPPPVSHRLARLLNISHLPGVNIGAASDTPRFNQRDQDFDERRGRQFGWDNGRSGRGGDFTGRRSFNFRNDRFSRNENNSGFGYREHNQRSERFSRGRDDGRRSAPFKFARSGSRSVRR